MDDKGNYVRNIVGEHMISRAFENATILHLESFMDPHSNIIKDMAIN